MKYLSIQESCRDKLHTYFLNNREYFRTIDKKTLKNQMVEKALNELSVSTEEIYEYIEELDLMWYTENILYN